MTRNTIESFRAAQPIPPRILVLVVLCGWILAFCAAPAPRAEGPRSAATAARAFLESIEPDASLQQLLDQELEGLLRQDARAANARLGIALLHLQPGAVPRLAEHNGNVPFYPASVVKFVYLMAAYAWQEKGRVKIDPELSNQLTAMIYRSSNKATQRVLSELTSTEQGPALTGEAYRVFKERRLGVKRWLQRLGIEGIHSIHPTYDGGGDLYGRDLQLLRDASVTGGLSDARSGFVNRQAMTPAATVKLLSLLASDLALSPEHGAEVRQRMERDPARQSYLKHRIAGGAKKSGDFTVYSKTGTWGPIFADAGIVRSAQGQQLALAVFIEATPPYRGPFIADLAQSFCSTLLRGDDPGPSPPGLP